LPGIGYGGDFGARSRASTFEAISSDVLAFAAIDGQLAAAFQIRQVMADEERVVRRRSR
jgi:hypothetical protein